VLSLLKLAEYKGPDQNGPANSQARSRGGARYAPGPRVASRQPRVLYTTAAPTTTNPPSAFSPSRPAHSHTVGGPNPGLSTPRRHAAPAEADNAPGVFGLGSGSSGGSATLATHTGRPTLGQEEEPTSITNEDAHEHEATTPSARQPDPRPAWQRKKRIVGKKRKANVRIATLNMNGRTTQDMDMNEKWRELQNRMKKKRIAIVMLQETHLNAEQLETLGRIFRRKLLIIASINPDNPTASAGIAFVIHKELINVKGYSQIEIVPGRAAMLTMEWNSTTTTRILNVYAPADQRDQPAFWQSVSNHWTNRRTPKPDFMMGDFNVVEDGIDRFPVKIDSAGATEALDGIKQTLSVFDAWRSQHKDKIEYTYYHSRNRSRLDRIYTQTAIANQIFDWTNERTSIDSDHRMIAVRYAPRGSPHLGKGRWTMPLWLTRNEEFMKESAEIGRKAQQRIEECGTDRTSENPQTILEDYIEQTKERAQRFVKVQSGRITSKMEAIQSEIHRIENDPELNRDEAHMRSTAAMEQELKYLIRKQRRRQHKENKARRAGEIETNSKMWSKMNKTATPRSIFHRLRAPEGDHGRYEERTDDMAKLAGRYFNDIQMNGIEPELATQRKTKIDSVLDHVPESQKLDDEGQARLSSPPTEKEIKEALKSTDSETAAGINGIPIEFWKALRDKHVVEEKAGRASFDVIAPLTRVFEDVWLHGVDKRTDFTTGWICPIHKKNDTTNIANYRPITLLNTHYKLYTKAISARLGEVAGKLIHTDQAGFMKGRSIFNHVRLSQTMIALAEETEQPGMLIALDQEKAYDRIRPDYLWRALETFGLPDSLIAAIKALYDDALTTVSINGVFSPEFKVTRGVRQGDPLSCMLFNLAIEPLACMLREDNRLKGYQIKGRDEKLIVNLYADDTVVYLNVKDSYTDLNNVLNTWCAASGAKFNTGKTELIPIGPRTFREEVLRQRKWNSADDPIPPAVRIAQDGDAVRSLGAFIGNTVDDAAQWAPTMEKIQKDLDRWSIGHPTIIGKQKIIQMVVGGLTQYKARVQGMPKNVESRINAMIRHSIWDGKQPAIALETLQLTKEEGGIGLIDIGARNTAIQVMWLKAYLDLTPTRPDWALVTDILINKIIPPKISWEVELMNPFLQTWDAPTQGDRFKLLPQCTKVMLKTANKLELTLHALKLSEQIKANMPAWMHPGIQPRSYYAPLNECLKKTHKIALVKDLIRLADRTRGRTSGRRHTNNKRCACEECRIDRMKGCTNPNKCSKVAETLLSRMEETFRETHTPTSDNLTHTPERRRKYADARPVNGEEICFDPTVTVKNSLADAIRIFTENKALPKQPATRVSHQTRGLNIHSHHITMFTDGGCTANGKRNAACGSGIWVAEDHPLNSALRIPGPRQSNQIGELIATIVALQKADDFAPVTIVSDSLYVIEGATKHLTTWEDEGFIDTDNSTEWRALAYQLRKRSATTSFKWQKGHAGDEGNEEADKRATEGLGKPVPDQIDLEVPSGWNVPGAKLQAMTQRLAYKAVRRRNTRTLRDSVKMNVATARAAIEDQMGTDETDASIWKGSLNAPMLNKEKQFFWKALHGAHKCGPYWEHRAGREQWAECQSCQGHIESITHILTECTANKSRETVWAIAEDLWPGPAADWPQLSAGSILAIGSLKTAEDLAQQNTRGHGNRSARKGGSSRLLNMLLATSAFLVWKLRCERVCQGAQHSQREVIGRWRHAMNERLWQDISSASRHGSGKGDKSKLARRVRATWTGVLESEAQLPEDWATAREFLAGIRQPSNQVLRAWEQADREPRTRVY
jgi:ribonuclease HI/exonuclease III